MLEATLVRLWGEFTAQRGALRDVSSQQSSLAKENRGLQAQLTEQPVTLTGPSRRTPAEDSAKLVDKNRELEAQLVDALAMIDRVHRERSDAERSCVALRYDVDAYDAVFRVLGMRTLRRTDLAKVVPTVADMAPGSYVPLSPTPWSCTGCGGSRAY
jgi:hypothetical protein